MSTTTPTPMIDREHREKLLAHTDDVSRETGYDRPNGMALTAIQRHRDADIRTESNFVAALGILTSADSRTRVVSFGHWGWGWIEEILIPLTAATIDAHREIVDSLADYPLLDETDYSEREWADFTESLGYDVPSDVVDLVARRLFDDYSVCSSDELSVAMIDECLATMIDEVITAAPELREVADDTDLTRGEILSELLPAAERIAANRARQEVLTFDTDTDTDR